MQRRRGAQGLNSRRGENNIANAGLNLLNRTKVPKKPIGELIRCHGARGGLRSHVRIACETREIEVTDIQSLFVDSIDDDGHSERIGADNAIFCCVADALDATRQCSDHWSAGWNYHDV